MPDETPPDDRHSKTKEIARFLSAKVNEGNLDLGVYSLATHEIRIIADCSKKEISFRDIEFIKTRVRDLLERLPDSKKAVASFDELCEKK